MKHPGVLPEWRATDYLLAYELPDRPPEDQTDSHGTKGQMSFLLIRDPEKIIYQSETADRQDRSLGDLSKSTYTVIRLNKCLSASSLIPYTDLKPPSDRLLDYHRRSADSNLRVDIQCLSKQVPEFFDLMHDPDSNPPFFAMEPQPGEEVSEEEASEEEASEEGISEP